jgi:hypothetical protein
MSAAAAAAAYPAEEMATHHWLHQYRQRLEQVCPSGSPGAAGTSKTPYPPGFPPLFKPFQTPVE